MTGTLETEGRLLAVMVSAGTFGVAVGHWTTPAGGDAQPTVELLAARTDPRPRMEACGLLPLMDSVLSEAGVARSRLSLVACSRGPGAFTGVRISLGVAQGLGLGLGIPVVPVCSLRGLGQTALRLRGWTRVLAAFDARMGEVYWRLLDRDPDTGLMTGMGPARLDPPQAVTVDSDALWFGVGDGCALPVFQPGHGPEALDTDLCPRPEDLLPLAVAAAARGGGVPAARAAPRYLRQRVAEVPAS